MFSVPQKQKPIPMKGKRNSIYAELLKPIQSAEVKAFMMLLALGIGWKPAMWKKNDAGRASSETQASAESHYLDTVEPMLRQ
jgi:hypothetical protein